MTEQNETEQVEQEPIPDKLWRNTKINGVTWLGGVGPKPADIMFISPVVSFEEAEEEKRIEFGKVIARTPRFTDSGSWQILKALALGQGINIDDSYVTAIVKYLPKNKNHWSRPPKTMLQECMPILENEIRRVKPKIIVCVGKLAFDILHTEKLAESDVYGAWFDSPKYNCRLYPMLHISNAIKPEKTERWRMDFRAIATELRAMHGVQRDEVPCSYMVIRNSEELRGLVAMWKLRRATTLSIDGEWHGNQHVDGHLRTMQFCWAPGQAACIRFMDDQLNYVFDVSYKEAGEILSEWVDRPEVKYIGHHVSVDLTWMSYWLGVQWYQKAIFDTEFALQLCDESLDLGLDAVALRYTPFGKYDLDLIRWKKAHSDKVKEGYGYIPDDILLPYSMKDVDVVMRAYPYVQKWMEKQGLTRYYNEIANPFVTDVFTYWCLKGIPVNRAALNEMRDLYNWAKGELQADFRSAMVQDAKNVLRDRLTEYGSPDPDKVIEALDDILFRGHRQIADEIMSGKRKAKKPGEEELPKATVDAAVMLIKQESGIENWADMENVLGHYIVAPSFNIRSKPQMARWLFDVKKYTPVKSTANKAEGMPAVDWQKVLAYPEEKQKLYTPASDKGTLEILARRYDDKVIDQLLELNAVGNLTKAFLKPADIDDDGELVKENGIAYWLASDDKIHLNHSCTETGRPRSWNPNVLNWPSYIHARVGAGMLRIINDRKEKGQLPNKFDKFSKIKAKNFPTVRSVVSPSADTSLVIEADYQTAEMIALAYITGDAVLLKLLTEPDDCFAKVKPECVPQGIDPGDCVVRLKFPDYIRFPEDKDKYIMTYASDGIIHASFTEDQLLRDASGKIVSPKFDSHWQILEISRATARESQNKKKDRGAGKVVNFSSSYGGTAGSIARKIEQDTGNKLSEDEAQSLLNAVEKRQPRATEWFKEMEQMPKNATKIVAASGRIRHLHTISASATDVSSRTREGIITSLGRECRNFPIQERVGSSASRACVNIVDLCMRHPELKGYPGVCLYDSIVIFAPFNERALWAKILQLYMSTADGWVCPGRRILRFGVDTEFNTGWGTHPASQEVHDNFANPEWEPTPPELKPLEEWVDSMINVFNMNPDLSVYNTWDFEKYS